AALDAATKYPWQTGQGPAGSDGTVTSKFGVYADDLPVFEWLRAGAPERHKCLEAQVMDLADDISYSVHDVEDAIVGRRMRPDVLSRPREVDRILEHVRDWYDPDLTDAELEAAAAHIRELPLWAEEYDGS